MSLFGPTLAGSAGQGPSADLGNTIDQSLRFGADSVLHRDFSTTATSNTTGTFSFWVKKAGQATEQTIVMRDNNHWFAAFPNTDQFAVRRSGGGFNFFGDAKYRDPSAWYHCVVSINSNTATAYVNGVKISTTETTDDIFTSSTNSVRIGSESTTAGSSNLNGYLAEFIFVDGQALDEEDFGRYNEDGIWVPIEYTGTYGTNGYHLTFDSSQSPNGIGQDSSGNNNHFTAVGFDTADVALWSSQVFTTGYSTQDFTSTQRNFYSTSPPTQSFDGNTNTAGQSAGGNSDSTYFVRFTTPIQNVTLIEMKPTNGSGYQYHYINGTQGTFSSGAVRQTIYSGSAITLETVGVNWISSNAGSGFYQLWVNGTELIDNTDNDVDYFDTPTSNYPTWNPLASISTNVSLTDANLRLGTTASQAWTPGYLTFGPFECGKPGKYYFEMNDDGGTGYKTCNFGVTDNLNITWSNWWWNTGDTLSWYPEAGLMYRNGTSILFGSASNSGGKAMAIDFEAGTMDAYNGGTLVGSLTGLAGSSALVSGKKYYIVAATSNSFNTTMPFNFGQMPFIFTPPTGYKALQNNNLPEPTIKDGSEHFQVITGAGSTGGILYAEDANDTSARSVTRPLGTLTDPSASGSNTYTPYSGNGSTYSWIWDAGGEVASSTFTVDFHGSTFTVRSSLDGITWNTEADAPSGDNTITSTNAHRYVRIQGPNWGVAAGSQIMTSSDGFPILSLAQAAFPNGLWWIKDRQNTNQHQLVDSVRGSNLALTCPSLGGDQAYSAPSGNSVAWCWNYDSSDPSVNGFEIITYTGNGTPGRTVSHNLGKAPDFIITKERNNTGQYWAFYHSGAGVGYGYLNDPLAYQHSSSSPVMFTATSSTDWTYDANGQVNGSGTEYVSYAWTSVPGYSAFGKYSGNQDPSGPFIYTGFTPRFLLLKGATIGSDWILLDSARSTSNPRNAVLYPNYNLNESIVSTLNVDFLSNGFKIRTNNATLNQGYDYLYACFAEHPFGGENQPPATAQ